jgi:hypothetical protein
LSSLGQLGPAWASLGQLGLARSPCPRFSFFFKTIEFQN